MTSLLSPAQLAQLRVHFIRADKTGAGSLSAAQLTALLRVALAGTTSDGRPALQSTGSGGSGDASTVSELEVQDLLSVVDVGTDGGEGRCDFEQFVHVFCTQFGATSSGAASAPAIHDATATSSSSSSSSSLLRPADVGELQAAFRSLDLDGDDLLSALDLQQALREQAGEELELEEVEAMVREVDTSGTGRITLADFLAALTPA